MTDFTLSKTKYIAGLQCPKLLWTHYHAQKMFPPTDVQTQAIFDQGHEVTAIARTLFPEGIEIKGFEDYDAVLGQTQQLLAQRKPLFEPAFRYKNTFARADVLNPNSDDSWDLYEVKSSTEAKDVHYPDLAFQKYCYQGSGLRIKRCYLILVNNSYIRKGALDPKQFLSILDISKEVEPLVGTIEKNLEQMLKILNEKSSPEVKIGPHCNEPYECGLKEHCWDFLPEDHVFVLSRLNKVKGFQLIEKKICKVTEIPEDFKLTDNQRVQWQCHKSGETHRNISEIKNFISQLKFPIYFLDFETVSPAIPFYDLSWPYQQVPFQFSLHILSDWESEPEHHGYLATGTGDPRPELMARLKKLIGPDGTVLSYNMNFELSRLKECAETFPEYQVWFQEIQSRFIDLIVPFRSFDYYDPRQLGKTSIKNVYPALTGESYEGLEIADGGTASLEFARTTFRDGVPEDEKAHVRAGLETYCKLDTQAMIKVLHVLRKTAG